MNTHFKGYSTFRDVKNVQIRTWNRCSVFFNIMKDLGKDQAQEYMQHLDDIGRQQVKNMFKRIREEGYSSVRKEVVSSHA